MGKCGYEIVVEKVHAMAVGTEFYVDDLNATGVKPFSVNQYLSDIKTLKPTVLIPIPDEAGRWRWKKTGELGEPIARYYPLMKDVFDARKDAKAPPTAREAAPSPVRAPVVKEPVGVFERLEKMVREIHAAVVNGG